MLLAGKKSGIMLVIGGGGVCQPIVI